MALCLCGKKSRSLFRFGSGDDNHLQLGHVVVPFRWNLVDAYLEEAALTGFDGEVVGQRAELLFDFAVDRLLNGRHGPALCIFKRDLVLCGGTCNEWLRDLSLASLFQLQVGDTWKGASLAR